jgi:hypothetical protein
VEKESRYIGLWSRWSFHDSKREEEEEEEEDLFIFNDTI